ncbi:Transposon TX1 uncharacterized protein [Merluccius polli]|uniref:Transposon TX1 uncharacterized protein n=1 Tax=Merluccius polli TaxID=89951 RepID=A0AA47P2K3_MERPO|nr:Transposon TX1 uncharacterized protein [Merluccius polli]
MQDGGGGEQDVQRGADQAEGLSIDPVLVDQLDGAERHHQHRHHQTATMTSRFPRMLISMTRDRKQMRARPLRHAVAMETQEANKRSCGEFLGEFESCFTAGMASAETPSLSIRHGLRVQPNPSVPVEEVLLAVGDQVGHANLSHASRMNKGVVVFVKEERLVADLLASGVTLNGLCPRSRSPLPGSPSLFIPNEALEQELQRFRKMASGFKTVGLGCKSDKLKHVQSFRRHVHMFLTCPSQTLDVSFRVRHGEGNYMVYASSGSMKCFECGDVGHRRAACPHRPVGRCTQTAAVAGDEVAAVAAAKRRSGPAPPTESGGGQASGRQMEVQAAETAPETAAVDSSAVDSSAVLEERPGATEDTEEVQTAGEEIRGGDSGGGQAAEADQSQAAGVEVRRGESGGTRTVGEDEEGTEEQTAAVGSSAALEEGPEASGEVQTAGEEVRGGHSSRGQAAESDQSQAAGVEVRGEESGGTRSVGEDEEGMECDSDSDCVSVADSQSLGGDMYTLEEINNFLDETFGRSVKITDYFPDPDKFMKTVTALQKMVGVDILDEKKRFRLKKHMTAIRKTKKGRGIKRLKTHVLK